MRIEMIEPFQEPEIVENIVSVYKRVFGDEPWNEGYRCPVCKNVLPLRSATKYCALCESQERKILMTECWSSNQVLSDFYREMQKSEARCLIAHEANKLVGFAWGYQMSNGVETSTYLEAPNLHNFVSGDFFYLDEVAVLPEEQGAGLGRKLVTRLLQNKSQEKVLLRTLDNSQMFHLVTRMGGKTILPISRGRVIMQLTL